MTVVDKVAYEFTNIDQCYTYFSLYDSQAQYISWTPTLAQLSNNYKIYEKGVQKKVNIDNSLMETINPIPKPRVVHICWHTIGRSKKSSVHSVRKLGFKWSVANLNTTS